MAKKKPRPQKEEENTGIELSEITEAEWNEMKVHAIAIRKTGMFGNDLFKSGVYAFTQWISNNNISIMVEDDEPTDGSLH